MRNLVALIILIMVIYLIVNNLSRKRHQSNNQDTKNLEIIKVREQTKNSMSDNQFKPIVQIDYSIDSIPTILGKLSTQDLQYLAEIDNGQYDQHILKEGIPVGDIKLLSWLEGKSVNAQFPAYFIYGFQINARKETEILLKRNYIRYATSDESLHYLKVIELKEILKENNLPVNGKKADLLERIQQNLTVEARNDCTSEKDYYCITASGIKLLEKYPEDYVESFKIPPPRLSITLR